MAGGHFDWVKYLTGTCLKPGQIHSLVGWSLRKQRDEWMHLAWVYSFTSHEAQTQPWVRETVLTCCDCLLVLVAFALLFMALIDWPDFQSPLWLTVPVMIRMPTQSWRRTENAWGCEVIPPMADGQFLHCHFCSSKHFVETCRKSIFESKGKKKSCEIMNYSDVLCLRYTMPWNLC